MNRRQQAHEILYIGNQHARNGFDYIRWYGVPDLFNDLIWSATKFVIFWESLNPPEFASCQCPDIGFVLDFHCDVKSRLEVVGTENGLGESVRIKNFSMIR
jgi:hypothetical protein